MPLWGRIASQSLVDLDLGHRNILQEILKAKKPRAICNGCVKSYAPDGHVNGTSSLITIC